MAKERDQEFLEYVIKALVGYPDDVNVDRKVDEMGVLLTLKVNPADVGQVIGKEGSTAKSIRTLMRIIGLKNKSRVNLKIDAPMLNKSSVSAAPSSSDSSDDFKI